MTKKKGVIKTLPDKYEPGFLLKLDRRTEIARALKHNYDCICTDLGGDEELSHLQRSLVERAVFLEAVLQNLEAGIAAARGDKEAAKAAGDTVGKWVQAVNAYVGLCSKLGLERRAHSMPWLSPANGNNGKVAGQTGSTTAPDHVKLEDR